MEKRSISPLSNGTQGVRGMAISPDGRYLAVAHVLSRYQAVSYTHLVVVLARELTLAQIRHIIESIRKEGVKGPSGELLRVCLLYTSRCV